MDWCRSNGGNPGNFYNGAGSYTGWGCHPIPGQWKCGGVNSADNTSTGSLMGDTLNLGANLWIIQNVKNPYSAVFLQSFTKGFLTGLFSDNGEGQRQRELMQDALRRQQLEAIEKARLAEKQRIDAIFTRLKSELKLSNVGELGLKLNGGAGELALKLDGVTDGNRDLALKIGTGDTEGSGIKGLPGIYVGGPADANSLGGLQLKLGQGNEAASTPTTKSLGIPGLPGIYLDNVQPSQAANLASAAINLPDADRRIAEEAALAAAQKNPEFTQSSDDPFVQDYQKEAQEYAVARQSQQAAWQAAAEAEGHVEAEKATIDYVRSQVDPAHATQEQTTAIQDMLNSQKSDEEIAVSARQMFEQADIHLTMVRHYAASSLAVLGTPVNTGPESGQAGNAASSATASAKTSSLSGDSSLPVIDPGHATVPILYAPPSGGKPFSESVEACVARFAANSQGNASVPTLEELQRKLEGEMTAVERLAKSEEEGNEELKEWSEELRKAHLEMTINGIDTLLGGLLNVTKINLEIDQSMVKNELQETLKQGQELRKEVVAAGEQIAAGGDPAVLTTLKGKVDQLRSQARPLIERRELLKRELENTENWKKFLEYISYPRDFGLWLTDSTMPCDFDKHSEFTCEDFKKNNAISKWAKGDLLPRFDLLKQALKFGAHNMAYWKRFSRAGKIGEALADIAGRANFIEETWDITSLVIDDLYDGTAIYLSHQRLQRVRQNNAQFEKAELMLSERIDRLHAQIDCYQKSNANTAKLGK